MGRRARALNVVGLALALLAPAGCSSTKSAPADGGTDSCPVGFLGDGGAPDFAVTVLQADDSVVPVAQGDTVPMLFPPQGGRVIFVGVDATNVDGCQLQLTGAVRDLKTQEVRVDSRTINLIPIGGGHGVSGKTGESVAAAIANFANVAVCPNEWSSTNLYGTLYGLEVTVRDKEGRQLTKKLDVTPVCGEPARVAECECICQGGYVLGQECDGGSDQ
jgi:hypothetical protein